MLTRKWRCGKIFFADEKGKQPENVNYSEGMKPSNQTGSDNKSNWNCKRRKPYPAMKIASRITRTLIIE